jgi:hypothetical protein
MKYAIEMGSGAMIYKPSFINIGSGIQKLIRSTHRQHGDCISLHLFFKNKEYKLKNHVKVRLIREAEQQEVLLLYSYVCFAHFVH